MIISDISRIMKLSPPGSGLGFTKIWMNELARALLFILCSKKRPHLEAYAVDLDIPYGRINASKNLFITSQTISQSSNEFQTFIQKKNREYRTL